MTHLIKAGADVYSLYICHLHHPTCQVKFQTLIIALQTSNNSDNNDVSDKNNSKSNQCISSLRNKWCSPEALKLFLPNAFCDSNKIKQSRKR